MIPLLGKILNNRYFIEEHVGRGGMAEVYRAYDQQREVYLALKVLREDLAEDKVFLRRFEREAKILAMLQHPNIVRFYGFEHSDGYVYMLMEYVEGETLRKRIAEKDIPMSEEEALAILDPVCRALHYAHQMGRVHCDVKSANILIQKDGHVYLTDFGIARGMDMATSTMVGIGTPAYMAPELIKGQDPTPQTDIYALGIVLYEMLTGGERPFTGERATITGTTADKVRWEHLQLKPTPMSSFNREIPPELEKVVMRCLEKDPQERYDSTMEILDDLKKTIGDKEQDDKEKVGKKQSKKNARPVAEKELKEPTKENKPRKKVSVWGFVLAGVVVLGMIVGIPTVNKVERNRVAQTEYIVTNKAELQTTASSEVTNTYISSDRVNSVEWECVYQVQNGDTLGQIFSRFNLNFSLEQDSFYYYEYCEFNGSNSTCSWKKQVDNYNEIYPEIWLIINSHEEGKNGWESESCLNGGGLIHFLTNLEETQPFNPIDTITPVYEIGSTMVSSKDGMVLVYVPEGEFLMGSENGEGDEDPEHTVYLDAFWIDSTEVTNAQYRLCYDAGICSYPNINSSATRGRYFNNYKYENYPVIGVDWYQAKEYCEWAGKRLPTEAEWEKAARGTDGRTYPWGEESPNADLANYNENDTKEVGSYPAGASPYGALDMAGNVREWVADWHDSDYYDSSPFKNPQGPVSGTYRVIRGGGSWDDEWCLRTANRNYSDNGNWNGDLGFRCALSPEF